VRRAMEGGDDALEAKGNMQGRECPAVVLERAAGDVSLGLMSTVTEASCGVEQRINCRTAFRDVCEYGEVGRIGEI
jgi:hypothetical protein